MKPFIPHKLPLKNLNWEKFQRVLGPANRAVARYDGLLQSIPNPAVLLSPLTTQEAVLSSKIEGTQATLEEVLRFQANPQKEVKHYNDIREIINYRKAMGHAINELDKRPLSLNLIKSMHSILLDSVRGQNKSRGKFRTIQNWIGKPGSALENARFVPPSPLNLPEYLSDFEKYIHADDADALVQAAIIHAQFEILHPFIDGNGRIGRILIPLYLYSKNILHQPMFYISAYLEKHREEYYDQLKGNSDNGEWENWIRFFLTAVDTQARLNTEKAQNIIYLYNSMKQKVVESTHSQYALPALDSLFNLGIFTSSDFQKNSGIPKPTNARIISTLREENIIDTLEESSGRKPAIYIFRSLIKIVSE
ncbi:MAG: Fic family protein [Balneolaceae bacterium]|nr:Fic family protein [Balneolaceae bacterium]